MEEVMKIISMLDDEDKQILSKFANTLIQKNKYSRLRKEIAFRRAEVENGDVLSHKELWQDFSGKCLKKNMPDLCKTFS